MPGKIVALQTVRSCDFSRCVAGAQNDAMALGAHEALTGEAERRHEPAIADIRVTGCDGLPGHGQRCVMDGTFAATVVIPPTAGKAFEGLSAVWAGAPSPQEMVLGVSSFPELDRLERGTKT